MQAVLIFVIARAAAKERGG